MPKREPHNPIQAALQAWLPTVSAGDDDDDSEAATRRRAELARTAPKRFTIYEPMALFPSGSFSGAAWAETLAGATAAARERLWTLLLRELSTVARGTLTHIAVNEGIPAGRIEDDGGGGDGEGRGGNILRSPTGLRMLYGDFGPGAEKTEGGEEADKEEEEEEERFDRALWVSTRQNGIYQTWAPRWTMFSRGNVKEKARILQFGRADEGCLEERRRQRRRQQQQQPQQPPPPSPSKPTWAVDLYAGIGYFAFSYAALGMRVLCWELNPWSVEALRRGAAANGWSVRVVATAADLARPVEELVSSSSSTSSSCLVEAPPPQIIVFLQDNQRARDTLRRLQMGGIVDNIAHVNAGLLPTSKPSWEASWDMARRSCGDDEGGGGGGVVVWLHLHENVGVRDVEMRRREIEERFRRWNADDGGGGGGGREVAVPHVERVKTFAPGVWHCVFDVCITRL